MFLFHWIKRKLKKWSNQCSIYYYHSIHKNVKLTLFRKLTYTIYNLYQHLSMCRWSGIHFGLTYLSHIDIWKDLFLFLIRQNMHFSFGFIALIEIVNKRDFICSTSDKKSIMLPCFLFLSFSDLVFHLISIQIHPATRVVYGMK